MKVKAEFHELAKRLIFTGASMKEIESLGYQPRKGVTAEKVARSIRKGMKDGRGKAEHKIEMVELQLSKMFKSTLALTPSVIRSQAVRLRNDIAKASGVRHSSPGRYQALGQDAKKLARRISQNAEEYDLHVAMMALDHIETREAIGTKFQEEL